MEYRITVRAARPQSDPSASRRRGLSSLQAVTDRGRHAQVAALTRHALEVAHDSRRPLASRLCPLRVSLTEAVSAMRGRQAKKRAFALFCA